MRALVRDSKARRALYECLRALPQESFCDPVTGLPGRATFECYLAQMMKDYAVMPRPWALGLFALDEGRTDAEAQVRTSESMFREAAGMIMSLSRAEDFLRPCGATRSRAGHA